ncbi:MAG: sulfotransferase [Candidatus Hydrogenedentales bacterium]|jgi:hypothetical protein
MIPKMLFIIGAPRSGTTMLERMLASHSKVQGGPEPHIITPLAHLGLWAKVDKAPYDHILAAQAQQLFVSQLPHAEADYWDACRAYCDTLYGRYLQGKGEKEWCLDKTPAYGLVLPFLAKVYPDAAYIVLTRHPLAIFSSFANSFFDGDYEAAHAHNPIIERYVPAMAEFLRMEAPPTKLHVPYEELVKEPELWFERICRHIGIPYEPDAIDYGKKEKETDRPSGGLGDPIGVKQHTKPNTASIKKWVAELASDDDKRKRAEGIIASVHPDDLAQLGYPIESLWQALEEAGEKVSPPKSTKLTRYRFERKMIMRLRAMTRKSARLQRLLRKIQLFCDVLLREQ